MEGLNKDHLRTIPRAPPTKDPRNGAEKKALAFFCCTTLDMGPREESNSCVLQFLLFLQHSI